MSLYATEPQNLTLADVDRRIRDALNSSSTRGSYVPRGIPQISVDIPIVANLPLGAEDGSEVNLRVGDGNTIRRMLYLKSVPGWVEIGREAPEVVTVLPTSPFAGQQVIYDTGTDGVRWHLVYDTSDGTTYPWLVIGGSSLYAEVQTSQTTNSSTYVALTTAGPTVTLPLGGDYTVSLGTQAANDTAGAVAHMSYDIGGTGAVDADGPRSTSSTAGADIAIAYTRRKAGLTAVALTSKYKQTAGGIATFGRRWISAMPVRVG